MSWKFNSQNIVFHSVICYTHHIHIHGILVDGFVINFPNLCYAATFQPESKTFKFQYYITQHMIRLKYSVYNINFEYTRRFCWVNLKFSNISLTGAHFHPLKQCRAPLIWNYRVCENKKRKYLQYDLIKKIKSRKCCWQEICENFVNVTACWMLCGWGNGVVLFQNKYLFRNCICILSW